MTPIAIIALSLLLTFGSLAALAAWNGGGSAVGTSAPRSTGRAYLNLTIAVDPTTGFPRYSPANFTVPRGELVVMIVDRDLVNNWSACACTVTGTVGAIESINGTPYHVGPAVNVAHSFTVPPLGLQVLSPGQSTITFGVQFDRAGSFVWLCIVPCGSGSDPTTTPPMGVPGFMSGTLSVT